MAKSSQVESLEARLKRPLYNLDDYGFLYEPPAHPPRDRPAHERLMQYQYRKCCLLNQDGEILALNLSSCGLRDASFLQHLPALQSLALSYNPISDASFLQHLPALQSLDLRSNPISDASFLQHLPALQSLDLSGTQISDYSFLRNLPALQSLALRNNKISDASFLQHLPALQSLDLSGTQISDASFLRNLPALQSLALRNNKISDASFLQGLPKIRSVDLGENRIEQLPEGILKAEIEIEEGEEFGGLPGSVCWYGNPIQSPPQEVLRQGHEAIVQFFQAGEQQDLREAKVLVVGEAEVGKTSLIKQLLGEKFDPKERKTHDIARHRMPLTCAGKGKIDLRVWDFGGQDIMHATHQFFLTRRCVYLLVLNSRQNESQSRIDYWLRLIESFGAEAPVIVVCNKCDEEVMNLPWRSYQEKFPQIKHYVKEVSCSEPAGIAEVKQRIAEVVADHLPHVGEPVPQTWFAVKTALENKTKKGQDYLTRSEFDRVCRQKKVQAGAEKTVLQFLHDLGVVLHYDEEHPLLKEKQADEIETKVLNPAWVSAAIYRVLNDAALAKAHGLMTREELERILEEVDGHDYDRRQTDFILGMMDEFDLCFRLPDKKAWLIPDLLQKDPPDTGIWDGGLRFRYEYSVLPASVISRFIVRMEKFISQDTYWRFGVLLQRDGIRALVKADLQDGVLDVALRETKGAGAKERREFLAVIRAEFERIHGSFSEKFEVTEFAESTRDAGVFQDYRALLQMERAGETEVWVKELGEKRPIAEFLDGVTKDRRWPPEDVEDPMPPPRPEVVERAVYLSFPWKNAGAEWRQKLVDQLQAKLAARGIELKWDQQDLSYRDSIREFMRRIGRGQAVIVVLSKAYLESPNCMFELTEIAKHEASLNQVFPVVLPDAGIYDPLVKLDYIEYWDQKIKTLDEKIRKAGGANTRSIQAELDLYTRIRGMIDQITEVLGEMNALTSDAHEEGGFEALFRAIVDKIEGRD